MADYTDKLRRLQVYQRVRTPRGVGVVASIGPEEQVRVARRWDPDHGFDRVETFHVREVEVA